ncbi:MAG: hypothetical protein ACP5OG_05130 [Candidatus Nanoarchaeia archaeon]
MNYWITFIWIQLAFIAMAFLEKTIEGPNAWASKSYSWKYQFSKNVSITEYHLFFWLFIIILGSLPLFTGGFSFELGGFLLSAFLVGFTLEDFTYFIVNPYFGLSKFNSKNARWYPWVKLGKIEIPLSYFIGLGLAFLSWFYLWA